MKVYVTKYALSKGIIVMDAELCNAGAGDMIKELNSSRNRYFHGKGRDWHETHDLAIKRAEEMKGNKIKYLHNQLNKLNKLTFK